MILARVILNAIFVSLMDGGISRILADNGCAPRSSEPGPDFLGLLRAFL